MYNLRYHIASLASVFIALALGLVLGGLIVDDSTGSSNQAIVESLQADFAAVREQSAETQKLNDLLNSFVSESVPASIHNQLEGYAVIVIRDETKTADVASQILAQAGASVIPVSINTAKLAEASKERATAAAKEAAEKGHEGPLEFDVFADYAKALAQEWTDHTLIERPIMDELIQDGILEMPVIDWPTTQVLGIVDAVAPPETAERTPSIALLQEVATLGFPGILVSTDTMEDFDITKLDNVTNISAVDELDSAIGSYSLVALLKGAEPGLYGTMRNAVSTFALMPHELKYAGKPIPEPVPEAEPTPEVTQ